MAILGITMMLVALGVVLLVWLGALAIFVTGRRKQSRLWAWLGGVPLVVLPLVGIVFGGWILYVSIVPPSPASAYKNAFGAAPPGDVAGLQSSENSFGDNSQIYLKFKAAPTTIQGITAKGWKASSASEWFKSGGTTSNGEAPSWWKPAKTARIRLFRANKRLGNFSTFEEETLIYDAGTQQTYYSYDGLD